MGKRDRLARQQDTALSRRGFLLSTLGGGLAFGLCRQAKAAIALTTRATEQVNPAEPTAEDLFEPNIWCAITREGIINVHIVRAEIGQHIGSALARMIMDEMDANWDDVRLIYVDTEARFAGKYSTGGSRSVWASWDIYRQAGASARKILVEEAARLLDVPAAQLSVQKSVISGSGKHISFGDIAAHARPVRRLSADEMAALPLKPANQYNFIGKQLDALDIPDKTTGKAVYGIDVHLPDMLYARPKLPPTRYGKVISVDDTACKDVEGYERYVILEDPSNTVPGWVMAVARTWPAAMRAADRLVVEWEKSPAAHISEADLQQHAKALIADPKAGVHFYNDASVAETLAQGNHILSRTYTCAPVAHFTMEPVNAIIRKVGDLWEVHAGNQWQSLALPLIAEAMGTDEKNIVMRTYLVGGGFGRKLAGDYIVPAALTSKAMGGQAIKMVLTRADDMAFDTFRSPSLQTISAALDDRSATIRAMRYNVVAGWPSLANAPKTLPAGLDGPYDGDAVHGANHWYEVGPFQLRAICNDLANKTFRPGWLRAVGPGWTSWALESFMDEAALALKTDPVSLRLSLLTGEGRNAGSSPDSTGGAKRQAHVLRYLADKIDWPNANNHLPEDTAIGLATTFGQDRDMPTWIAMAVQVHVNRQNGVITCQKIWCVVDAGIVVDPDGAAAQVEGGILWGMSMALFEGSEIVNGLPKDRNLNSYTPLRLADTPEIDLEFIQSTEKPCGLGEPGVTPVAPALGNAVFNAVGIRLRHMPMRPHDVRNALAELAAKPPSFAPPA